MRFVSIVTPCFNEEENVEELHRRIQEVLSTRRDLDYEHIFIDNASRDRTVEILRGIAAQDPRVKVIVNARNFGHIRSPYHALLEARGDAVIGMASDLQDPPELIPAFLDKWEAGSLVVIGVKRSSEESGLFWLLRSAYYRIVRTMADVEIIEHFTGFGLYDQRVIEILRGIHDPYPYFRGLISEIGFTPAKIAFDQPLRKRGITKNNFYTLWDMAMLGITTHTRVPLRIVTLTGFILSAASFGVAFGYLGLKLLWWDAFQLGSAPLLIGTFFISGVQLAALGILGEYVGLILTHVRGLPHVVERERIGALRTRGEETRGAESRS